MLFLVLVLIFASVYLALQGIWEIIYGERILVKERLTQFLAQKATRWGTREELQQALLLRLGSLFWNKLSQTLTRQMGAEKRLKFQRQLQLAGNPWGLNPGAFRLLQLLSACFLGSLCTGLGLLSNVNVGNLVLLTLAGLFCGAVFPKIYLGFRIKERRSRVLRSLPDVLDLLMVSVEAGLGFEIALVKVTERFKGVLAEEFGRVLQEMKLGKPRREALKDMAERLEVDDFTSFVSSITQADQLGVSIGNILRLQAEQMRHKRRQRAEEQAMQAPVKMLFPLVFFIFPTLFIVLLGPAFIQIMRNLRL